MNWLDLWSAAGPIGGTLATRWLAEQGLAYDGSELRWHPSGIMLALVRDALAGEPKAVHITEMGNGVVCRPRMIGPADGGAVMLDPWHEVTIGLCVSSTLEAALAYRQIGCSPMWAMPSPAALRTLPPLGGVEALACFIEPDASGAAASAAHECARRWQRAGKEILIKETLTPLEERAGRYARRSS